MLSICKDEKCVYQIQLNNRMLLLRRQFCKLRELENLGLEMGKLSTGAKGFACQGDETSIRNMVTGTQDQGLQIVTHFKSLKACISNGRA
jgi:hypothetical protein